MRAKRKLVFISIFLAAFVPSSCIAQHEHRVPGKVGKVNFPISCSRAVQPAFNHAVALLHSFAYLPAREEFLAVSRQDPRCAMAHWGVAISYFHQLWDPPISSNDLLAGVVEIQKADALAETASEREQSFIHALSVFYSIASRASIHQATLAYTHSLREAANANPDDAESQIFYALAFLSIASPLDRVHTNQKWASQILEPLYEQHPDHPGIAHYLIHTYDHPDLASLGLKAARSYSKIAPSAPHALHMPSHIFTLLGLWSDSIKSNLAARTAAHQQGDIGEELHAMDYLIYADLQTGRVTDASKLLLDLQAMQNVPLSDYKVAYAFTVMPIRFAFEQRDWENAAKIVAPSAAAPQFQALTEWANSVACSHLGRVQDAESHFVALQRLLEDVRKSGDEYWISQVVIQVSEAQGWLFHAKGEELQAIDALRQAVDQEDLVAKRPITPGPVLSARAQLGAVLLEIHQPVEALREFEASLKTSPRRRTALAGALNAAQESGNSAKAEHFTAELDSLR